MPRVSPGNLGLRWAPASIFPLLLGFLVLGKEPGPHSPPCSGLTPLLWRLDPHLVLTWAPVLPTVSGLPKPCSLDRAVTSVWPPFPRTSPF